MLLPMLNELPRDRELINTFGGYNHKLRIGDGEFYDMENLSSDHYPVLSVRKKRGSITNRTERILGMIAKDRLFYVTKNFNNETATLYSMNENGEHYIKLGEQNLTITVGDLNTERKKLISMGAYVIVMPDKKWIKTIPDTLTDMTTGKVAYYYDQGVIDEAPDLDLILESQNRLWGCRYGLNQDNEFVNEIYASKQGDFNTWDSFEGNAQDSYTATLGSEGKFTGAINYRGLPIFFKENCIHTVYGSYPANYQIETLVCEGVQDECEDSVAIINGVVYYKARSGIFAYDGSMPVKISDQLGDISKYLRASAGVLGDKYYISMADPETLQTVAEDGNAIVYDDPVAFMERVVFVYDTKNRIWYKETSFSSPVTETEIFCNFKGNLYFAPVGKSMRTVIGTSKNEDAVKWYAETGIIGVDDPDKKYVSRLDIKMSLEIGAKARFYIQYDSSGEWEYLFTMTGTSLRSFSIPIRPKRCDHFRLKLEGEGDMKLFSLCKNVERGSNV